MYPPGRLPDRLVRPSASRPTLGQPWPVDALGQLVALYQIPEGHQAAAVLIAAARESSAALGAAEHNPGVWPGTAGVTDWAFLAALVELGAGACTVTPSASTRQLSELANTSPATAATVLQRLLIR